MNQSINKNVHIQAIVEEDLLRMLEIYQVTLTFSDRSLSLGTFMISYSQHMVDSGRLALTRASLTLKRRSY